MASCSRSLSPNKLDYQKDEKNLICSICHDVFSSPRILPCFHSFCTQCLQELVTAHTTSISSPRSFPCPTCRQSTQVPASGVTGFQANMYITQGELDRARTTETFSVCRQHASFDERLTFYCLTCDDAICMRCKLTQHEGHRCEDLPRGADCDRRLGTLKRCLDVAVDCVEKDLQDTEFNQQEVKRKKTSLKDQVQAQHDSLVLLAGRWRDRVLRDIEKRSEDIQTGLSSEKSQLMFDLECFKSQRWRVLQVMEKLSDNRGKAADVEKVMKSCADPESLPTMDMAKPSRSATLRPGLDCRLSSVSEEDFHRFIGLPITLQVPPSSEGPAAREVVVRFYRCLEGGSPRQVHALCVTGDRVVHCMYGDSSPGCSQWGKRSVGPNGLAIADVKVSQKFVFRKFSNGTKHCISHHKMHTGLWINSKSGSSSQVRYSLPSDDGKVAGACALYDIVVANTVMLNQPKMDKVRFLQTLNAGKPLAMDVTADKILFAVLEEKSGDAPGRETETGQARRSVRIYRSGQEDPIATYTPPQPDSFFPTDVCFWKRGGKEKLLVADYTGDSVHVLGVHVVNARRGHCRFERYLAAGRCGDLVKPTALDTDPDGRLWIGCGTGWILRCEAVPGSDDFSSDTDIVGLVLEGRAENEGEKKEEKKCAGQGSSALGLEAKNQDVKRVQTDVILVDSSDESDESDE